MFLCISWTQAAQHSSGATESRSVAISRRAGGKRVSPKNH